MRVISIQLSFHFFRPINGAMTEGLQGVYTIVVTMIHFLLRHIPFSLANTFRTVNRMRYNDLVQLANVFRKPSDSA